MSALPEWLWPQEDEEAVQEAERLIEETHNTLRRMEAGIKDQRISGQHIAEQAEKLKSEVNKKMHLLEKELKSISEPTSVNLQLNKKYSSIEHRKMKPVLARGENHNCQHHNVIASTSQSKSDSKVNEHFDGQQQAPNISSVHSVPKQWKNVNPKWSSSTAEQVVLTAKAKVQDALDVARDVTASLDQHVSAASVHSRPLPNLPVKNVGIFEVKSQSDRNSVAPKRRLGQTMLPSISIKRGLEKQSIPSIQVLPEAKIAPSNVSVCNMKYDDFKEESGGKLKPTVDSQSKNTQQESMKFSVEHPSTNTTTPGVNESAVIKLSRQLEEVEELREVNQAQVNHVLRFLLSRVCNSTPTERTTNSPLVTHDQGCDQPNKSHTTSSSDSSQYPIAYDSLSRFLETYKRAADQSMLARKRATVRRQKEVAKQKREIEKAQTVNHLLIGPLRQASQAKDTDCKQPMTDSRDLVESYSSSSSHQEDNLHVNPGRNSDSLKDKSEQSISFKEMRDWNSPLENSKSISNESVFLPVKSVGGVSGEEYEDDWEEEDHHNKSSESDDQENLSNSILQPIIEAEELVSSLSQAENQKHSVDFSEVQHETSKLSISQTVALERKNEHQEKGNKEISEAVSVSPLLMNHSHRSSVSGQGDSNSVKMHQIEPMVKCANISEKPQHCNGSSMSGNHQTEDSVMPVVEISQEKPSNHPSSGNNTKQHQSLRRRTQMRHQSLCSSSSDAEMNESGPTPRNPRRWDLSLREDLQLQSAILLNWQLEDRLKKNNNETSVSKEQQNLPTLHSEVLSNIERGWQRTLDQLDQRLRMIEDNERIHRIANEIKLQSRQECTYTSDHSVEKLVSVEKKKLVDDEKKSSEMKVPTKDIMVQTSPEKNKVPFERKEFVPFLTSSEELQNRWPEPNNHKFVNSSWQKSLQLSEDLTAELLKYSRMGIFPREGLREVHLSKSSSSSTTSSHFQQSSAMVSLSDGELRNSVCGSCSCSEGQYCVCGGRKLCSERAPPDGSQTLSDGENFMKDVSQGEIPSSSINHFLKDTSFGEIPNHVLHDTSSGNPYMAEESIESDDIEWELK